MRAYLDNSSLRFIRFNTFNTFPFSWYFLIWYKYWSYSDNIETTAAWGRPQDNPIANIFTQRSLQKGKSGCCAHFGLKVNTIVRRTKPPQSELILSLRSSFSIIMSLPVIKFWSCITWSFGRCWHLFLLNFDEFLWSTNFHQSPQL